MADISLRTLVLGVALSSFWPQFVTILSIVRARCKSAMHLDDMRTNVMRERRMATTVGLIILLLCFMFLPVLAAPFILHNLGYPFEDQPPLSL